jgi:hypothetical protein
MQDRHANNCAIFALAMLSSSTSRPPNVRSGGERGNGPSGGSDERTGKETRRTRAGWRSLGSSGRPAAGSVGATFQLTAKFGVGGSGGIRKVILISLTSGERRARLHIWSR